MRLLVVALAALLAGCGGPPPADAPTTVYLVRHAEKAAAPPGDPPLTARGAARAEALADMLEDNDIVAVYSSQFERTRATVRPLADRLGLPVVAMPLGGGALADTLRAQVRRVVAEASGRSAVIAGHSNTVPTMVATLTGEPMADLDESAYGDLFVVTVLPSGTVNLQRWRFGD